MKQPINTGLCSFGMSGRLFHAPFLEVNPNFNLYGVLERSKDLAKKSYPEIIVFKSLEDMLSDQNIELVIINTPNITHFEFAKRVIQSGKHLVVEKPFTASVSEAEQLIRLAKLKNVCLSVYHNRRWDSDFKTVSDIVHQGVLGEIIETEIHYDRYDANLSYKIHKETPTAAVGNLYDLGSHIIDQAIQLFGMPEAVYAQIKILRPSSEVADYFDLKLYYGRNTVTLKSSYFVRESLPAYILHGTKGSFIKTRSDIQESKLQMNVKPDSLNWGVEPDSESGLLHIMKEGKSEKRFIKSEFGNYMDYYDQLFKAIRCDSPLPVTAEEGQQVIRIIEAALKSNNEKRMIAL